MTALRSDRVFSQRWKSQWINLHLLSPRTQTPFLKSGCMAGAVRHSRESVMPLVVQEEGKRGREWREGSLIKERVRQNLVSGSKGRAVEGN